MSVEIAAAPTGPTDTIAFSNVTLVRNQEGDLSIWVGNEKMMGLVSVNVSGGAVGMAIPLTRVRFAEDMPATQVRQTKGNVIYGRFTPKDLGTDGLPDGSETEGN